MKNLDTHTAIKNLIAAGISEKQAEVIVSTITIEKTQSDLVTKSDLKLTASELRSEMHQIKAELKAEIAELRTELKAEIAELRTELKAEIAEIKRDMKWGMALLVGIMALSLSMLGVLAKLAFLS